MRISLETMATGLRCRYHDANIRHIFLPLEGTKGRHSNISTNGLPGCSRVRLVNMKICDGMEPPSVPSAKRKGCPILLPGAPFSEEERHGTLPNKGTIGSGVCTQSLSRVAYKTLTIENTYDGIVAIVYTKTLSRNTRCAAVNGRDLARTASEPTRRASTPIPCVARSSSPSIMPPNRMASEVTRQDELTSYFSALDLPT